MYFGSVRFFKHLIVLALLLFSVLLLLLAYNLFSLLINLPEQTASPPMETGVAASEQTLPPETLAETTTALHTTAPQETGATTTKAVTTAPVTKQQPAGPYDTLYPELYCPAPERDEPEEKTVYLTFDDGPSERTAEILDLLKEKDIKATFFVIGRTDKASADLMRRIVEEGHTIGVHSYTHQYAVIYKSVEAFLDDFNRIYQLVYKNTGIKPDVFRFPGGSVNDYNKNIYRDIITEMQRRGFTYYDWNVDSYDSRSKTNADSIKKTVIQQISRLSRSIVLMHDSKYKKDTVSALGGIIDRLLLDGYRFDKLTSAVQPVVFGQ